MKTLLMILVNLFAITGIQAQIDSVDDIKPIWIGTGQIQLPDGSIMQRDPWSDVLWIVDLDSTRIIVPSPCCSLTIVAILPDTLEMMPYKDSHCVAGNRTLMWPEEANYWVDCYEWAYEYGWRARHDTLRLRVAVPCDKWDKAVPVKLEGFKKGWNGYSIVKSIDTIWVDKIHIEDTLTLR